MGVLNWMLRNAYAPATRAYARQFVGDKPADGVLVGLARLQFAKVHGYWPHLKNPRSFEEKVNCRMLFSRDPIWTRISDKFAVRDYVVSKGGEPYLVPLLWHGESPDAVPFERLPSKFVIKANHGCYFNIIVQNKSSFDVVAARKILRKWLGTNFCDRTYLGTSWAYRNIRPSIIVEQFLEEHGKVPLDYKFFCFGGRAEYVQMNFDRFGDSAEKFFDRDFKPLELGQGIRQCRKPVPRPENYDEMIHVAECMAQGLDFIRVDLYNIQGRIYFGELTCYPSAGCSRFVPESYDFLWGEKWTLAPYCSRFAQ